MIVLARISFFYFRLLGTINFGWMNEMRLRSFFLNFNVKPACYIVIMSCGNKSHGLGRKFGHSYMVYGWPVWWSYKLLLVAGRLKVNPIVWAFQLELGNPLIEISPALQLNSDDSLRLNKIDLDPIMPDMVYAPQWSAPSERAIDPVLFVILIPPCGHLDINYYGFWFNRFSIYTPTASGKVCWFSLLFNHFIVLLRKRKVGQVLFTYSCWKRHLWRVLNDHDFLDNKNIWSIK